MPRNRLQPGHKLNDPIKSANNIRAFNLLKAGYKPGPKALKQPITDALRYLLQTQALNIAYALVRKAKAGSVEAAREIMDRVEGKLTQQTETTVTVNLAVAIQAARTRINRGSDAPALASPARQLASKPQVVDITQDNSTS